MQIRSVQEADLPAMATLAAVEQTRPDRHITYLGATAPGIAQELSDIDGWSTYGAVAEHDGKLTGWIVAEIDEEIGRAWWLGPFYSGDWGIEVDELYRAVLDRLPATIDQGELASDDRHLDLAQFAARHGFVDEEGSAILVLTGKAPDVATDSIAHLDESHHDAVWALHESAFPGAHLTRSLLMNTDERHIRLVAEDAGQVVGYVAVEVQADNDGYIDFLAVAPEFRGQGHGRQLIVAGIHALDAAGANGANLSVRESNLAARNLYTSLGFTEERIVKPYRRGFSYSLKRQRPGLCLVPQLSHQWRAVQQLGQRSAINHLAAFHQGGSRWLVPELPDDGIQRAP